MRQAHQKRSRNRGRKVGNNFNRTFDSNGPDVKIRGSASHIFDKYQSLARDAHSSGDYVAAENYYQHAEHYFRMMLAAQQGANGAARTPANAPQPDSGEQPGPSVPAQSDASPAANGGGRPNGRGRRGVATVRPSSEAPAHSAPQDPGSAPQPVVPAPSDKSPDEARN
jgi:hypothetical protein